VFVPNTQTPVTATAPAVASSVPALATEGPLDRILKWIIKFFAKIT